MIKENFEIISLLDKSVVLGSAPEFDAILAQLARTEDIRFSPNGLRLAIAGFAHKVIQIVELAAAPALSVVGTLTLEHTSFRAPHGLDWLDDDTLVVANRGGHVLVVAVQSAQSGVRQEDAAVVNQIERVGRFGKMRTPGSVAVAKDGRETGLWVCNNYIHKMSYHALTATGGSLVVGKSHFAIQDGLKIPDGVAISANGKFMAISNHETHQVFVYAVAGPGKAARIGQLNGVDYPHGVRFADDDTAVITADAGQPYLHVFRTRNGWHGDHQTNRYIRVLDDVRYWKGRYNTQEGGIKGIDIDTSRGIIGTTCETQALTFFKLEDVLGPRPAS